jgi:bacteriorhodopsin
VLSLTGPCCAAQLLLYSFALVTGAESGDILLACGTAVLSAFASEIGSAQLHPWKWYWWTLSVALWLVLALQMYGLFVRAKEAGSAIVQESRTLLLLLLIPFCAFPVLWVLGEEGLEVFPISYEVGFSCIADMVCKVVYGLYLLLSVLPQEEDALEGAEKTSLV